MKSLKYPLFAIFFTVISVTAVTAATDISLEPREYLDSVNFDVNVNTNNEMTVGLTVILETSGDITLGEIKDTGVCQTFETQTSESRVSITCIQNEPTVINDSIADIKATVGDGYSIRVLPDLSDLGGLSVGTITDVEVQTKMAQQESEEKDGLSSLTYISGGIFLILLIVLLILLVKKNRDTSKI